MLKNKISSLLLALVIIFAGVMLVTPVVDAQSKADICKGVEIAGGGSGCNPSGTTVESVVGKVINILSIFVGVVAVIMIIIGGFKYIISSGDSNNVNSAKNTILYAVIGLVVAALAQVIVRYVLNKTVA